MISRAALYPQHSFSMELVFFVGLGNPGPQYLSTRHNLGYLAIDHLAHHWGLTWTEKKRFFGQIAEGTAPGGRAILLKPTTFMNNSGQAVRAVADFFRLEASQILAIYDETALPLGTIRLRLSGSAGGHNGIKSLISHLGTQDFPRLRIGIDPKPERMDLAAYVLGRFTPEQGAKLPAIISGCTEAIEISRHEGLAKAMSLFNSRTF